MAQVVIDVLADGIEQGGYTLGEPVSDNTRCRGVNRYYIESSGIHPSSVTMTVTTSTGKTIKNSLMFFNTATSTTETYGTGWVDNPCTIDLSSRLDSKYLWCQIRYTDFSNVTPEEITAWTITYDDGIAFEIGDSGYPEPIDAPDLIEPAMAAPYPAQLWRIDPEWNGGYPFNLLQPNIEYVPPPPPGPTEIPTVQPIATSEITDQTSIQWKRYTVGYTNPDLFRFRDSDLPENTKCDVFIKGTNSYRYTEERDHIDGSQTTETP